MSRQEPTRTDTAENPLREAEPTTQLEASQQIDLGSDPPLSADAGSSAEPSPPLVGSSAAWRSALMGAVMARLVLIPVAWVGSWLLAEGTGPLSNGPLSLWDRWDATHLLVIAQHGYFAPASDPHAAAFFPLFPLATRALLWLAEPVVAGMLVTFAASVVAFRYLYGLSGSALAGSGTRAVAYLAFFPTALFLIAPYSEALFIAGATAAFYFAKQRRWLLVAVPAAVAVGARAAGIFLLFGLLVEFLTQRDFSSRKVRDALATLTVGALPLAAYFLYLQRRTGNFFYYFEMQQEGWGRAFTAPQDAFLNTWRTWNENMETNWMMVWRLEILAAILGLLVVGWALLRSEWGYAAYMGASLAALLTSTWYFSIPRMMLSFFPIAIFLATSRHIKHEFGIAAFAAVATLGAIVFTHSAWFF